MATRLIRVLKSILTGKRTDPVSPVIRDAQRALRRSEKVIRRIEKELRIGEATLVAVASRIR